MSNIESVMHETRVFEPPPAFAAQANVTAWPAYRGDVRRGRARLTRASGRDLARETLAWHKPFTQDARRDRTRRSSSGSRTAAQRLVQLPRPQPRERQRRQDRDHLRGRRRQGHAASPTASCYAARLPLRQRAEGARHQEGRPRRHLHADVDRGRRRDAGLRAHRRDALGGVRRLLGASRCRSASSTPARSPSSPPTSRCAAARRCR